MTGIHSEADESDYFYLCFQLFLNQVLVASWILARSSASTVGSVVSLLPPALYNALKNFEVGSCIVCRNVGHFKNSTRPVPEG
jgi:hypothetical protein